MLWVVLLCLASPAALAQTTALDQFIRLLGQYQSLSLNFQQHLFDLSGEQLGEVSGQAWMVKPNQVRWEVSKPYPQLIISDGQIIWFYDKDLLQATRRPFQDHPDQSVATLLLGDPENIANAFEVAHLLDRKKHQAFILKSKDKDSYFNRLEITFDNSKIEQIRLTDHSEQSTVFTFSGVKINPKVKAARFRFKPPKNVEINDEVGDWLQ